MKSLIKITTSILLILPMAFSVVEAAPKKKRGAVRLSYGGTYTSRNYVAEPVVFKTPRPGESIVEMGYNWQNSTTENRNDFYNWENKVETSLARLNGRFSIYEEFWGGVELAYTSESLQSETAYGAQEKGRNEGIVDPVLVMGYNFRFDKVKLVPTFVYQFKSGTQVTDETKSNAKAGEDMYEAGLLAVYNNEDSLLIGGGFDFRKYGPHSSQWRMNGITVNYEGQKGNVYETKAFVEFPGKMQPGVLASVKHIESSRRTDVYSGDLFTPAIWTGGFKIYSQFKINRNFQVIPMAGYETLLNSTRSQSQIEAKDHEAYQINMTARLLF